jgi:tRNA pseudouridine55 synthase
MYAAFKKEGTRLYELARKGEVVEREPRPIRIDSIELLEAHGSRLVIRVCCSKGTYVRTLVEDIAAAVGTVAHTANLHRESVGNFRKDDMLDLAGAEELAAAGPEALRRRLMPADEALAGWPECTIAAEDVSRFGGGQVVAAPAGPEGQVRVYGAAGQFLGIGECVGDGTVAPKRVFHLPG